MAEQILIPPTSRYKDTKAFSSPKGVEYGLFEHPDEFTKLGNQFFKHRVRSHEVGNLDSIAVEWYGEGSESLWWAIAQANLLIDPEREMFSGQVLTIPSVSKVREFTSRGSRSNSR